MWRTPDEWATLIFKWVINETFRPSVVSQSINPQILSTIFPEVLTKLVNNRFLCCLGARKWNDGHRMYIIWVESWRWHCKWRCGDFLLVDGCFLYKCWIRSLRHCRGSNINYILNYFFLFPQEFYGIDMWMLKKALGQLELKGKAQMFEAPDATDDSGQGVKFFS